MSARVIFLSTSLFCRLVGIGLDRFKQRRLRERACADVAEALGADDAALMPITPLSPGKNGEYDVYDALRLRAVVELEHAGMEFGRACQFIRSAGVSPTVLFPADTDIFASQWTQDGVVRRMTGSQQDLGRAMPKSPLAAVSVNLTAIREDVARQAGELGLVVRGSNFSLESDE